MNSIFPTPWSRHLLSTTHLIFPVFGESRGSRSTLQNNRFDWLVCRSVLAVVILMLCCFTMPSYGQNVRLDNGTPTPPTYSTMQAALAAAVDGNTITLLNNLSGGPIAVTKDVTIDGGNFTYTLNASGVGVTVSANGITIQNLTIDQSTDRGLQTSCGITNLTLSNVTISNSVKTAFNINGVTGTSSNPGATLTGLTATNNGGNGLSISDSKYVTVANYTSSGNKFSTGFGAGVGIFSGGGCSGTVGTGSDEIKFVAPFNVTDPVQIYTEGSAITNITLPAGVFTHFAAITGSTDKFYADSKEHAYTIVPLLSGSANNKYVQEISSGNMYVDAGMSVQTAINVAAAAKTVFVEAGTFSEALTINKAAKIYGAQHGIDPRPSNSSSRTNPANETIISVPGNQQAVNITSSDVEFDGFTVEHNTTTGTADLISSPSTAVWSNVKILNNIVKKATDEGIQLRSTNNSTIEKNYIVDSQGDGINMSGSLNGVGNIIQNNEIKDALSSYGAIYLYGIKGVEVRNNYIHGYTLGITAGVFDATSPESVQDIEIHHNRIEGNFPKLQMTNLISVGGNATSNVNVHNNYIKELPNTATNVVFVRIANNVTDVKVNNNYFEKLNNQKYLVLGFDDNSRIPTSTATIDASCNWFGSGIFSDLPAKVVNTPTSVYIPYLSSGTNTLPSTSLGFEPEPNTCIAPVYNVEKDKFYTTITAGIQDADPTNTLKLAAYTFTENVVINKPLTLEGATTATSIISGATSYGIYISANNVTVKNLTIANGAIQGLQTSCGIQNLTLTDITATANGKTGFNINGVNTATLTGLIATGNTGNGMSISDSKSVNVVNYSSSGNHFSTGFGAGVGLFSGGACVVPNGVTEGTDNVSFSGTFNVTDPVQLYTEGSAITNITLPGSFTYFAAIKGSTDKFYANSKANAYVIVPLLSGSASNRYVQEITSGNMHVNSGMSIQTAIDVAAASKTVFVEAGNFPGAVNVNKTLTVSGAGQGNTTLSGAADYGIYIDADDITINDLKVSNATLQGLLTNCGSDNVTITNVTVANSGKTGFNINGVNTATLKNITANNNVGNGLSISDSKNVTIDGLTTSGNAFTGGFSAGVGIFGGTVDGKPGACVASVGAGSSNIKIIGTININEPFKVYQQGNAVSAVTLPYTFFAGVGIEDKYYADSKVTAYKMAAAIIAKPTPAQTIYVEEIATGDHFVDDAVTVTGIPGTYSLSIQGAVNYLTATKNVFMEEGTFMENVVLDKALTLQGIGANRSIINPPASGNTGFAIVIKANNINIKHVKTSGFTDAVGSGLKVNGPDPVSNLVVDDIESSGNTFGLYVTNDDSPTHSRVFDNVNIKNSDFSSNTGKGIYLERAKNLVIENNTMNNSGTANETTNWNAGIDINLKFASYSDIQIKNNTITNSGTGTGSLADGPAAIAIKARDDASSYNTNPASLSNVMISGNTISGSTNGIRLGEFGKVNQGPSGVTITKNDLSYAFPGKAIVNNTNANIGIICNWHGTTDYPTIQGQLSASGTGVNVVSSYSTSATYASCTPTPCNITAVNNSDGGAVIVEGSSTRTGSLVFTAPAGYDTYKWYACTTGAQSTCNVPETNTTNILTRTFAQLGSKGVRLTKTLGGVTTECYFFFKIVPHITTSASTACSIVLHKNGSGSGTTQWYKDSAPITGATSDTYTATENGTYTVATTISGETYTSAGYAVSTVTGAISVSGQPTSSVSLCKNETPTNLTVTTTPTAASYQWYSNATNSNTGGTIVPGATSASFAPNTSTAGTFYYYAVATSSQGCIKTSNVSQVVVNQTDFVLAFGAANTAVTNNASITLCKNEVVPIQLTGSTGQTYTLTRPANAQWNTPIVIQGNVGDPSVNIPAGMSWNGEWTLVVNNGSCSGQITFDVVVNEPVNLPANGSTATLTIMGSGTNDLTANCEIAGTLTSADIAGASNPSVSLSTTLVNGYRKYTITPAAGSAVAATLTLYFTQADFNAFNAVSLTDIPSTPNDAQGKANLRILHTSSNGNEYLSPTAIVWNSTKAWWEIGVSVSHFSSFEPAAISSPLPVKLVSFKANKESDAVRLNWETTAESNSSHFDVEHSQDGKMWATIGTLKAANNSNKSVKYFLDHKTPSVGQNLYRLKMIDLDATFAYSSIQSVVLENGYKIALYPNPVSDILNLEADNWNQVNKVRIVDMNGRTIYSSTHQSLSKKIDVKSIASGSYVLEIIEKNGSTKTRKFVIMR